MSSESGNALPPPPAYGTGLMDRMNIFVNIFKAGRFILRRWWVFTLCLLVTGGFAGYKAYTSPDQFRSNILLSPTPKNVTDNSVITEPVNTDREREIIFSAVVDKQLKEWMNATFPENVPQYKQGIFMGNNFTFKLSVTSTDNEFSRLATDKWAELVLASKRSLANLRHDKKIKEEEQAVAEAEELLKSITDDITKYLETNPDVDAVKGVGGYTELSNKKVELEKEIDSKGYMLDLIKESASGDAFKRFLDIYSGRGSVEIVAADDSLSIFTQTEVQASLDLLNDLETKKSEKIQWQGDLKPSHPFIVDIDDKLQDLQRRFDQQALSFNTKLKAKERKLATEIEVLRTKLTNAEFQLLSLRPKQKEYEDLVTKQLNQQSTIKDLRQEAFKVRSYKPELNLDTLEAARSEGRVAPNRPLMVAAGVIGGFMLAGVLVFFLGKLDDRLEMAEDIERELQEHVLGQIPKVTNSPTGQGRFLITDLGLHDMFCESLRGVRSAFNYYNKGQSKTRSVVVTSAVPGDGKSTITVNFAATLAMAGHKVLVIDADLRRGSVNEFFDVKRAGGLSDVLSGRVHWLDVTRESSIPNLDIITTGKYPMNPGELLASPVVATMIKEAEAEYDFVIVDCPPFIAIDDAFSIFEHVDTGLFVIRSGQTSMRFIKNALHELDKRGQAILGIILNGITTSDPSYYYAKYYHSYYNKELPKNSVESSSVYQPAASMPAPKRRKPRRVSQSQPKAAGEAGEGTKDALLTAAATTENSSHVVESESGTDQHSATAHRKIVKYKARRAFRKHRGPG